MMKTFTRVAIMALAVVSSSCSTPEKREATGELPVRGLHFSAPAKQDLPEVLAFIRNVLPREGVNTLILEFNYNYDFQSLPEFASPGALNHDDARKLVDACHEAHVTLIPALNCLGHQSWAQRNGKLLAKHPEFDETPGKYPDNRNIYCRSYCPRHPGVHQVIFTLIDELIRDCEATSFHCGMDEVFILADADCPRCKEMNRAELFADEVKTLHDHLAIRGCRMWMWGDRLLDSKALGLNDAYEASVNGTAKAIDLIPKDIMICDWHYPKSPATPEYFARKGFDVVACPWRQANVALKQLARIRSLGRNPDPTLAHHARGIVQTTWCGFPHFLASYDTLQARQTADGRSGEVATCFTTLFRTMRTNQKED